MLKTKNPKILPAKIKVNIPISSKPTTIEIKLNAIKAIADNHQANPSRPSVKLTALDPPTNKKRINKPYTQPISI